MKMMRFVLGALALVPALALAANVVTYTATSKVSQKDADKKALEGAAMQISTNVKASVETIKTEDAEGNVQSTFESKKSVTSNVLLKGAKIKAGPKKNGLFQSTVSVDLDQLASKILVDMEKMRNDVKKNDSIIRRDMRNGHYYRVSGELVDLKKTVDRYDEHLENLSCLQKVSNELLLETTLAELGKFLRSALASVKMDAVVTDESLIVTVSDYVGPVENFPIVLSQDNKDLATRKTDKNGKAVFPMADVKKNKPSGTVTAIADINFEFAQQSGLVKKEVAYQSEKTGCVYKLVCDGDVVECGALQKFLTDAGLNVSNNDGLPELKATLNFSDKPNSARTLFTSRATIVLKYGTTELLEQPQGVGKDEESAHIKAITKLSANKVLESFAGKGCVK